MAQASIHGYMPMAPTTAIEFKFNFKLNSIIMLVGPDGSGKTEFAIEQLMLQLKSAQIGRKEIKIAHINLDQIILELLDKEHFIRDSFETIQITSQANDILFSKLKNLTSYPANFDFVIVDSNGLESKFREEILKIGEENHYSVSAILFNYKDKSEYFSANNEDGLDYRPAHSQMKRFKQVLSGELSKKEYSTVETIQFRDFNKYEIVVEDYSEYDQYMLPEDKEYVIIGDVHGCFEELVLLLKKNGFVIDENLKVSHPTDKRVLFVGDLIDKGVDIKKVVEFVYANLDVFYLVIGNHEHLVYKKVSGTLKKGGLPSSEIVEEFFNSIDLFQSDEELGRKFIAVAESMKNFYVHKNFIVTHAPCEKKYLGKISSKALKATRDFRYPKLRDYESFAEFMYEFDERTQFMRDESSDSHPIHVFGHVMSKELSRYKNKIDIDTACVAGGELTSIQIDSKRNISFETIASINNKEEKQLHNFFY